MAEDDISFIPWFFDESKEPSCPSFWEEYECDQIQCPFSHSASKYQSEVPIKGDQTDNPIELYTHLKNYVLTSPDLDLIPEAKPQPEYQEEKDFERINQLMNEMKNFEEGPEIFDTHVICPFLSETGNCVIRDLCEFAHSQDDQKIKDIEKEQEWYPSSMNCSCCKGYAFGCGTEECRKQGKCVVCIT